jgi:hypothetical protein
MISLQSIAQDYGLNDAEVGDVLHWSKEMREIGPENYFVNPPMEEYFRALFSPHQKQPS